ncbi:MAG: MG2 domain-containing protein [Flavobacteriales bacterium]
MLRKITLFSLLTLFNQGFSRNLSLNFSPGSYNGGEVIVNAYSYDYSYQKQNSQSIYFTLYKVNNPQNHIKKFAQQNAIFSQNELKKEQKIKSFTETLGGSYYYRNKSVNLGKLDPGTYILQGIIGGEIAQIPLFISQNKLVLRSVNDEILCIMSNKGQDIIKADKIWAYYNNTVFEPTKKFGKISAIKISSSDYWYNIPVFALANGEITVSSQYYDWYNRNSNQGTISSYIYPDRTVYRPGQTVYFKAVVREKTENGYDTPKDSLILVIKDPQNNEVYRKKFKPDTYGSYVDSLPTKKTNTLGEYAFTIESKKSDPYAYYYNQQNEFKFRIEEYKKPEYEVKVNTDKEVYQTGEKVQVKVKADYFFGAPVAEATVTYKVLRKEMYRPHYYRYWWYDDYYGSYTRYNNEIVKTGSGKINPDGTFNFEFIADDKVNRNVEYVFYASVTDASRREITGSKNVTASYTAFEISARSEQYYYWMNNQPVEIKLEAKDLIGKPVQTPIKVQVYKSYYRNVGKPLEELEIKTNTDGKATFTYNAKQQGSYYFNFEATDNRGRKITASYYTYVLDPSNPNLSEEEAPKKAQIILTQHECASGDDVDALIYIPAKSALLNVSTDQFWQVEELNNKKSGFYPVKIKTPSYAYGNAEVNIFYFENGQYKSESTTLTILPKDKMLSIEITWDQDKYKPGQTAFAKVKVKDYRGRPVSNASLSVATADESLFSIYPDNLSPIENYFYNTDKKNTVKNLSGNHNVYGYGQKATAGELREVCADGLNTNVLFEGNSKISYYRLRSDESETTVLEGFVGDKKTSSALAGAKISAGGKSTITDKYGYFRLTGMPKNIPIITVEKGEAELRLEKVTLSPKQNNGYVFILSNKKEKIIINQHIEDAEFEFADIAVQENAREPLMDEIATTGANAPASRAKSSYTIDSKSLRREDADENYKKDKDITPQDQLLTPIVRSDFRDAICWKTNLTTNAWGEADVKIELPDNLTTWRTTIRVVTADHYFGQATSKTLVTKDLLVRMETPRFFTLGDKVAIATTIHNYLPSTQDITVSLEADGIEVKGTKQKIKIASKGEQRIDWKVDTKWIGNASLTVKASSKDDADAMKVDLPVQPYGLETIHANSLMVKDKSTQSMNLLIPEYVELNTASVQLDLSPSITSALLSSIDDLIGYPYGCVEQTMSRFLPNVIVAQTLNEMGSDYASTIDRNELVKMVEKGAERLGELQHTDGGWGWWESDATHPFMTAYVVNGLYQGMKADMPIPASMLEGGKNSLKTQLAKKHDGPTQAYMTLVAMECGMKDQWKNIPNEVSNAYEAALWLQAAHFAKDLKAINHFKALLEDAAIREGGLVYWGGKKFYYSWQDDRVETTANAIRALLLTDENNRHIAPSVQWLMNQRKGKSWHNTRQTAMSIFALKTLIKQEINADIAVIVKVNNQLVDKLSFKGKDVYGKGKTIELKAENFLVSISDNDDKMNVLKKRKNTITIEQSGKGRLYVNAKLKYYLNGEYADKESSVNQPFAIKRDYYKLTAEKLANGSTVYRKDKLNMHEVKSGDILMVDVNVNAKSGQEYILIEDYIPAGCEFIKDTEPYIIKGGNTQNIMKEHKKKANNYWGWWSYWYTHNEFRDNRLAITVTNLGQGNFNYSYIMRAQIPGEYKVNPVISQLMYYPEIRGFSDFVSISIIE